MDGKPVTSIDARCGYVPQKYSLFPDRTVLGNVMYGPENAKGRFLARFRPSFFAYRRKLRAEAQAISGAHGFASAGHEQVSAPAFRRHAAARCHRAGAADASAGVAAGRGIQRTRSINQGKPAGTVAERSGWSRSQPWFLSRITRRRHCYWARGLSFWDGIVKTVPGKPTWCSIWRFLRRSCRFASRMKSREFQELLEHVKQLAYKSSSLHADEAIADRSVEEGQPVHETSRYESGSAFAATLGVAIISTGRVAASGDTPPLRLRPSFTRRE